MEKTLNAFIAYRHKSPYLKNHPKKYAWKFGNKEIKIFVKIK